MDIITEMNELREMSRELNARFDRLIARIEREGIEGMQGIAVPHEILYSLNGQTKVFKGKKPTGVIFPNGRRVDVLTWKQVAEVILRDCNSDYERHHQLLTLRERIGGRNRVILSADEEGMRSPRQIDQNLFFETHYDAETMLRVLVTRVLRQVHYDYNGISIAVLNEQ